MTDAVTLRWLDPDNTMHEAGLSALERSRSGGWRWLDVPVQHRGTLEHVADEFGLHPLLIEDAIHQQSRSKFDSYPDGSFVTWLYVIRDHEDDFSVHELDVFLGANYLITVHDGPMRVIDEVCGELGRHPSLGPDWLLHALIDRLVDSLLPYVDALGDQLEQLEDRLLDHPGTAELHELYGIRRSLARLHRIVSPQRDIIRGFARALDVVGEEAYRYFQDVGDHLARVEDSIEVYREISAAAMDIYVSAQDNRMNEIVKQLTVVATIFMPLTLISGIYGMNLLGGMWPPSGSPWSFPVVLVFMALVAWGMSLYFRRKKWW